MRSISSCLTISLVVTNPLPGTGMNWSPRAYATPYTNQKSLITEALSPGLTQFVYAEEAARASLEAKRLESAMARLTASEKQSLSADEAPSIARSLTQKALLKIAVVGGGIFGVTTAWNLAMLGYGVDLYDPQGIMHGATSRSNLRTHQGYYFPSPETAVTAKAVTERFMSVYGAAVIPFTQHYYGVAHKNVMSLTMAAYKTFLEKMGLPWIDEYPSVFKRGQIPDAIRASECILDAGQLRAIGENMLVSTGVHMIPKKARPEDLSAYDFVVHATYEAINELIEPADQKDLIFEVVEQVVVQLPRLFRNLSLVIFGDAMGAIDPRGSSGLHVLSHRTTMAHYENVGKSPVITDARYRELLRGDWIKSVQDPALTHRRAVISALSEYVDLTGIEYVGSIYALRALGTIALTEAHRPTLVHLLSNGKGSVLLGGKVTTALQAAEQVAKAVQESYHQTPDGRIRDQAA